MMRFCAVMASRSIAVEGNLLVRFKEDEVNCSYRRMD